MSCDEVKAAVEHRPPGRVPYKDFFMDTNARDRFLPELRDMSARDAVLTWKAVERRKGGTAANCVHGQLTDIVNGLAAVG